MNRYVIKSLIVVVLVAATGTVHGQQGDYNTKKGFVIKGYDVVSYFDGEAMEGDVAYVTKYDGVKFKFKSKKNLERFKENPKRFLPKYGGYCAYAIAVAGKKVSVNPETFEIRNGELLLFYNSGKNNTLESWLAESPEQLISKADQNWERIKSN